jgi:hypothetical protein
VIVNSIEDFLTLKPKGHYRITTLDGRPAIIINWPDREPESFYCGSFGIANQLRQYLTDEGMTGFVEGSQ